MTFPTMLGKTVPTMTFHTQQNGQNVDVTTDELFKGKKVVLFALPGAFTPTCSSFHLPRYNELTGEFKKLGVDEIVCLSVNDTFVMNAWAKDQNAEQIFFAPDGSGEFTEGMGRMVEEAGFGKRSWRYSMLVDDGVIVQMFDEDPNSDSDDPFAVSDADTMIKFLDEKWQDKPSVAIITKVGCPHCTNAKATLTEQGLDFEEIVLGGNVTMTSVRAITGRDTAPQVFIDGKHIGENDDLQTYFAVKN